MSITLTRTAAGTTVPSAGTYDIDPAHSSASVPGPAPRPLEGPRRVRHVLRARSTIADEPTQSSVEVSLDAASFTTGNDDRDGHVKSRRLPRRRGVPDPDLPLHRRPPGRRRLEGRRRAHHQGRHPPRDPRRRVRGRRRGSVGQRPHRILRRRPRSTVMTSASRGTRRSRPAACSSARPSRSASTSRPSPGVTVGVPRDAARGTPDEEDMHHGTDPDHRTEPRRALRA